MKWHDVRADPRLRDLPYKIEPNEYGKIVMSPQKLFRSILQGKLEALLCHFQQSGEVFPECPIATEKGTKVADVVWVSAAKYEIIKTQTECSIAPEICIEIVSDSNTRKEMNEKMALYFAKGAAECRLCHENGAIHFFDSRHPLERSSVMPDFPNKITL